MMNPSGSLETLKLRVVQGLLGVTGTSTIVFVTCLMTDALLLFVHKVPEKIRAVGPYKSSSILHPFIPGPPSVHPRSLPSRSRTLGLVFLVHAPRPKEIRSLPGRPPVNIPQ